VAEVAEATGEDLKMDTMEAQVVEVQTNPVRLILVMEAAVQQVKVMQEEILAVAAVVKYPEAEAEVPEGMERMVHPTDVEVQQIDLTIPETVVTDYKIQFLVRLFGILEAVEAVVLDQVTIFKVQMASEEDKPLTVVEDNVN
jgi:hypothetical protein